MITTILTGAGAVHAWKAPSTKDLTKALKEDTTFKTKNGTPVGRFLYQLLKDKNNSYEINFEHIINLVESVNNYINDDCKKFHLGETVFLEMKNEIEKELFDFFNIYEPQDHGYYILKVGGKEIQFNSKNKYLGCIYDHFIGLIVEKISLYEQTVVELKNLNKSFQEFLKYFKKPWLRYYTTNYDRLPLLATGFNLFEGFSQDNESKALSLDSAKINSRRMKQCYYNLHGSIHIEHEGNKIYHRIDKPISKPNVFQKQVSQTGEVLLRSSIITGMNKSSRILFSPHQQFYNSFYNDCLRTDNLIIIGYSFSDVHINQAIKEAIINKEEEGKLKVIIVNFFETDVKFQRFRKDLSSFRLCFASDWNGKSPWVNPAPEILPYHLYSKGVKEFLETKAYEKLFE